MSFFNFSSMTPRCMCMLLIVKSAALSCLHNPGYTQCLFLACASATGILVRIFIVPVQHRHDILSQQDQMCTCRPHRPALYQLAQHSVLSALSTAVFPCMHR